MKALLKIELNKAVKNKAFITSITIGIILAILSLIYCLSILAIDNSMASVYDSSNIIYDPEVGLSILFNNWIGGEGGSLGTAIFYYIFPILCALPYGWSYCVEQKSGYTRLIIAQTGKKTYFMAKYIATFISGGLAMIIPLITSILLSALFFPAITPYPSYDIYYAVFVKSMFSEVYYSHPFLYIFIYLCINFIFCGIITCTSMAAVSFIKQKYIVTLIPFSICMILHLSMRILYTDPDKDYINLSPFIAMKPIDMNYRNSPLYIFILSLVLFAATFFITNIWEKKHEVY